MKVLFLVPYPTEGPSNRYRVEQYLPYLRERHIEYFIRPFISSQFFKILYRKGNSVKKTLYFLSAFIRRVVDLINFAKFDLIFVHIEAFPFGPAIFEWFFSKLGRTIIYDFEDAIYLPNFRETNKLIRFLRCSDKFYQILNLSKHVIVCNKYMKDFVQPYNPNVTIIPTSIDTEKFKLKDSSSNGGRLIIGWVGSHTTSFCLKMLTNVFTSLAQKYDLCLKIIGGRQNFNIPGLEVICEEWFLEKDVEHFQDLDIGIYPLLDDERSKAKTPFKTIQYMSVGVPAVVSRIGGNVDIVEDGVTGFLASTEKEWIEKLSLLIENPELRQKIGLAGRKTVEEKYSVKVNAPKILEILQKVYNEKHKIKSIN